MSILYTSASGREIKAHSYSGGSEFKFCRRKYKLHRLDGWQERERKAALEFGKAIESAIQYFYENGQKSGDCLDEFKRIWVKFEAVEMRYTDQEQDWATLYKTGSELSALFEIRSKTLPIRNPKFQLEYRKEVFPGSDYAGLEFLGYVDLLSTAEDGTRTVVDIKTAKLSLELPPNMLSLDPQLRRYAWLTGVRDTAFLWLVKAKPDSFKKGDVITLLQDTKYRKAGDELTIFSYTKESSLLYAGTQETVHKLDEAQSQISGKGSTEAKAQILGHFLADGSICVTHRECVTKTRIQYVKATIPAEDLFEIGDAVAHEMVQVKDAVSNDRFPKDGGVRYPNNQCTWCPYRGVCLGDQRLRDELLVQIKAKDQEDDWLKELEGGEAE